MPGKDVMEAVREEQNRRLGALKGKTGIGFRTVKYAVLESEPRVTLTVMRVGGDYARTEATVNWKTKDDTAKAGEDYKEGHGTISFAPGEQEKTIAIELVDDNAYEPNEYFSIDLFEPSQGYPLLPNLARASVCILNDDFPGEVTFKQGEVTCHEDDHELTIDVVRENGFSGEISVDYRTCDMTALAGVDYEADDGTLVFKSGETVRRIRLVVKDDGAFEKDEQFKVDLLNAAGGGSIGRQPCCVVTIKNDDEAKNLMAKVKANLLGDAAAFSLASSSYKGQFKDAWEYGGDGYGLGFVMHLLCLPWKVFFATIPPNQLCGGWLSFLVALGYIGVLTAFIGDFAGAFGCIIGLKPSITAITFVALGTSLPDTFASMAAAVGDDTADAAIGNVTGSNAVNVFLGLGMPWLIAAIYWASPAGEENYVDWRKKYNDTKTWGSHKVFDSAGPEKAAFAVPAGSLGFSVGVFVALAICCLLLFEFRRRKFGYELGGKQTKVSAVFLVFLWFMYVALSWMKVEEAI